MLYLQYNKKQTLKLGKTVKDNEKISLSSIKSMLQLCIMASNVSVRTDDFGQEYSIELPGDRVLFVERNFIYEAKATFVEYKIWIDDDLIDEITIHAVRKILMPRERDIVDIVNSCSDRVIQQEIQARHNMLAYLSDRSRN